MRLATWASPDTALGLVGPPVLSGARRDERPPDVARPGALALRVGRACTVRP